MVESSWGRLVSYTIVEKMSKLKTVFSFAESETGSNQKWYSYGQWVKFPGKSPAFPQSEGNAKI